MPPGANDRYFPSFAMFATNVASARALVRSELEGGGTPIRKAALPCLLLLCEECCQVMVAEPASCQSEQKKGRILICGESFYCGPFFLHFRFDMSKFECFHTHTALLITSISGNPAERRSKLSILRMGTNDRTERGESTAAQLRFEMLLTDISARFLSDLAPRKRSKNL